MYLPEIFLALLIVIYCVSLPPLLKRAGQKNISLGYLPIVQFIPFLKMIKRPWWWIILLLLPGVNLIMLIIINVELGIAFGKRSTAQQWLFGVLPWYAIPNLAFKEKDQAFIGPRDWTNKKKGFAREWGEAIVFAIVAASVIRTFFIEAFTIPTPSMEKSMLVGDYLFVSKMSYGAKIPQTPVSVPFVHNAMPGSMTNSYVDWFSLPNLRLPGFGKVERFDPVVFNFPNGDTILVDPVMAGHDYYQRLRAEAITIAGGSFDKYLAEKEKFEGLARKNFSEKKLCTSCPGGNRKGLAIQGLRHRPVDKKENYIKRCIGLPGENLFIKDRQVFINDQPIENPDDMMWNYYVTVKSSASQNRIAKELEVAKEDMMTVGTDSLNHLVFLAPFSSAQVEKLKTISDVVSVNVSNDSLKADNHLDMYPNSHLEPFRHWSVDNFGPIHIPYSGETIDLTPENIALYKRVIDVYEENQWEEKDGKVYINGQEASSYTFKYNYYWMMGDNRHHSADSRYWGFVPETHVVGKAVFTWFSKSSPERTGSSSIRWNRMFRLADKD